MSGFDYFYGIEAEQYSFYQVPKILFQAEQFKFLSCEAKVLYGLLLDRMNLSRKNRWFDKENRPYIIFTVEEIVEFMNCGAQKAVKLLKELDVDSGIGLIEKKRLGFGKPNIIYVKNFMIQKSADKEADAGQECSETQSQNDENHNSGVGEKAGQECSEAQSQNDENHNSEAGGGMETEFPKSQFKNDENHNSRMMKTTIQEFPKSQSNNTDINKTDFNNTNNTVSMDPSIYPITASDVMDREKIKAQIHKNIDYTALCNSLERGLDHSLVDELVEVMLESMMTRKREIRISGEIYNSDFVKSRLLKIDMLHIQYVLDSLENNHTQIRNIKAYLLTALFNAPVTINNYYQAKVNHGMAELEAKLEAVEEKEKPEQDGQLAHLERALVTKNWKEKNTG